MIDGAQIDSLFAYLQDMGLVAILVGGYVIPELVRGLRRRK